MKSDRHDRAQSPSPGAHAHVVESDGGERLQWAGMEFVIRASAESTGGAFSIIEEIDAVDAPPHIHTDAAELFYVLEGRHIFTVGETEYEAGPGDMVFVPKGIRHAQRRVTPNTGRTLTMFSPPGMEGFFRELAAAEASGEVDDETVDRITTKYGAVWVD
jgi:mannose-6-phosphate isomerase-like protein (cupin superfamily)